MPLLEAYLGQCDDEELMLGAYELDFRPKHLQKLPAIVFLLEHLKELLKAVHERLASAHEDIQVPFVTHCYRMAPLFSRIIGHLTVSYRWEF